MAENSVIISSEEEAKLLKPIDEYVEEIQKKIDALRADGFDKVSDLKKQIAIAKENKNLSATQRDKIIENSKKELENAKKVEADNKEEIKKLIAEAESYLAAHYKKDYYDVVNKSCKAAKAEENSRYEKVKADLKSEHQKKVASLKDAEEIKAEKYVLKNKLFDAQMAHESKLQEIKDRRHEAFMHKYHLIDLLRASKFTFPQQRIQKLENYRYTFDLSQFLYKNGLYIVIILIFIALCIITPIVKNTQLLTVTNILNTKYTMQQQDTGAQPQMAAMKWMMYLMPIMFLFVLNDYPSGLNYYYFISTLISVVTMIILRRTTDENKLLTELEAKKKDPKQMKKTGFAARLEAMQKQQEQLAKERANKQNKK